MALSRRAALAAGLAAFAVRAAHAAGGPGPLWIACRRDPNAGDGVAVLDAHGEVVMEEKLPARGHSFAIHPSRDEAVVFARRPGRFAVVLAPHAGLAVARFDAPADRHFHGHGFFTADGRLLIATENDWESARGILGIYDAADGYRRVGEIESHGIEPHEALLHPDARTLVVANGGIHTRPDRGRAKLNLPTMRSTLAYLELDGGRLLAERALAPALQRLSLRHLAVGAGGGIAVAMQWEGDRDAAVPLLGIDDGSGLRLLTPPPDVRAAMRQYVGSLAFDPAGEIVAASCPKGNIVTFWRAADGAFLGRTTLADGCGVAPGPATGLIRASSGTGRLLDLDPLHANGSDLPAEAALVAWDNHLRRLA